MDVSSFITAIGSGELDSQLSQLAEAISTRQRYLRRQREIRNQSEFVPGTRVRITQGIKPKYLIGVSGTVSSVPASRTRDIRVDIDEEFGYLMRRFGMSVGVPASTLARIGTPRSIAAGRRRTS